jgi:predicted porin
VKAWLSAIAGLAMAAPACASDTLELYGRAYALFEFIGVRTADAPALRDRRVSNQSSMMGVRGAEALAPGLEAWFQLETAFPLDAASGPFANRNSAVGFRGAWGTLLAGRWDSAFEQSQVGVVDPFSDQGLPDITAAAIHQGNFARRQPNAIQYWSPAWNGLQVKLAYAANEGRTALANPYDYGASVTWRDESSYIGAAYERHVDQTGALVAPNIDESGYGLAASHRMGRLKLDAQLGAYERTGTITQRSHALGFEYALPAQSRISVLGIYQHSRNGGARAPDAQPSCSAWGSAARYAFSPRTFAIVEYARVRNHAGRLCNFGSNPVPTGDRQTLTGFAFGLRTIF